MSAFGTIPKEPARSADLGQCAPRFADKVRDLIARLVKQGEDPMVREALRSSERCAWLYGFGRDYDDDRGIVTNAATGAKSWHSYGLAADIVSRSKGDNAPMSFWAAVANEAEAVGLEAGFRWKLADKPHVQWKPMRTTPSDHAWELMQSGGLEAVWREVQAL